LAAAALLIVGVSASYYLEEDANETALPLEQWQRLQQADNYYDNYNDKLRQLLKSLGELFGSFLENSPDYSNSENDYSNTELCFWIEFTCGNGNCIRKSSYGFQQACPIIEELL